jgi:hypothetical protein
VEFEFVGEMNLVQIGTNECFPQLIRFAANARHLQSRPHSNQKLGRRDQSAASSELFLSFTLRSFPTGTRDGAENHASHNLAVLGKGMFVGSGNGKNDRSESLREAAARSRSPLDVR